MVVKQITILKNIFIILSILALQNKNLHTSTFEARKTQVGAMSTGSMLFREYLQMKKG